MKYNIIGDIHSRTCWKDIVKEDCINVFTGDYFAPYERVAFDDQSKIFLDIIKFKEDHPETVLLLGNHDEDHWHIRERYSRFDLKHVNDISKLFEENKKLFQVAYATKDNKVFITHAGVSAIWLAKYKYHKNSFIINLDIDSQSEFVIPISHKVVKLDNYYKASDYDSLEDAINAYNSFNNHYLKPYPSNGLICLWRDTYYLYDEDHFINIDETPNSLASFVNNLWLSGKYSAFNFENNSNYSDCYGESYQQGPMWIRPNSLKFTNIFATGNALQVVGHTQYMHPSTYVNNTNMYISNSININDIDKDSKIIYVDCLGYNPESIIYDGENFIINKA